MAGSNDKHIVEFHESYHELQKEPNKDEIHAKVLEYCGTLLRLKSRVKPFGVISEKDLRFGHLRRRKSNPSLLKRLLIFIIYILIGYL